MTRTLLLLSILVGTCACGTSQPTVSEFDETVSQISDSTYQIDETVSQTSETRSQIDENEIADEANIDVMPELIGGIEALFWRQKFGECRVRGRTVVEFIVDENGNVLEPSIVQSTSRRCDKEVIRLVTEEAKFTPGRDKDGNAIKVKMRLPVIVRRR